MKCNDNGMVEYLINGRVVELTAPQSKLYELFVKGAVIGKIATSLGVTSNVANKRLKRLKDKIEKLSNAPVIAQSEPETESSRNEFLLEANKHLKRELRKAKKGGVIEDRIVQLFEDYLPIAPPQHNLKKKPFSYSDADEELVLLIGDTHIGEIVDSEDVMGLNHYDVDVVKERVNKMYNAVEALVDRVQGYNNNKLNIFFLGDIVSGLIHDELMRGETPVAEQTIIAGDIFIELIREWSQRFPLIEVFGVVGNHGRLQKKVQHKKVYNNFDWLAYKRMELGCEMYDNITFSIGKSKFARTQIFDWNFLLMHGDTKSPSYAGIPFYGIKRASTNITETLVSKQGIYPHYICQGHIHSSNALDKAGAGKIYINGSMIGTSDYGLNALSSGSQAKQTLLCVHKKLGVTFEHDLYLD